MTSRAEVAALAGERQQEFVLAGATTHSSEAVLEDSASHVLLHHLGHDGAPVPPPPREPLVVDCGELLEVVLDEAIQR
jgi:hypothetical protein